MKICIWRTGHSICDTVAEALAEGLNGSVISTQEASIQVVKAYDLHVAYGVLRGTAEIFRLADEAKIPWVHLDKGYTNPHHYSGTYRISYKGTQARWHEGIPRKKWDGEIAPWRNSGGYILICPPTEYVCEFFGVDRDYWLASAICNCRNTSYQIRDKGDDWPLELAMEGALAVITFNSSVGWKALQMGIPVLSDVNHSIIGSHYGETDLQKLLEKSLSTPDTRRELFEAMSGHDYTLEQIRKGEACELINHYLSGSASMTGKQSLPMSASIPSKNTLQARFQSNT